MGFEERGEEEALHNLKPQVAGLAHIVNTVPMHVTMRMWIADKGKDKAKSKGHMGIPAQSKVTPVIRG